MRIIIEIDEQRMPGAPSEISQRQAPTSPSGVTNGGQNVTVASGQMSAIDAGIAAPLAESGAVGSWRESPPQMPSGETPEALSAGAAPEQDSPH